MTVHICFSKRKNCWNLYETCMSCIGCGCCSSDPKERAEARLKVSERMLQEQYDFDAWDEDERWKETQRKNIKANIKYFRRCIRYYKKRLQELEEA